MDHPNRGRRVEPKAKPSADQGSSHQRNTSRKRRRGGRTVGTVFKVLGTLCLVGVLSIAIFLWIFLTYVKTTLAPELEIDLNDFTMNLSSEILYQDENGDWQVLETLYGTENRIWVDYENIPKCVIDATIAIEDQRFESHHGVDWRRTASAVLNMFLGMKDTHGGSTITQQVIKNLTEEDTVTVKRKVTEIFRALELEKNFSKEDIMEVYLNKVYFGQSTYGIGAAAKTYFGKDVQDLTLAEAASIVGITNNPSMYDPLFNNVISHNTGRVDENGDPIYEDWSTVQWNKYRQELILAQMLKQGKITQAEHDAAVAQELVFVGTPEYEALHGSEDETEEAVSDNSGSWSYFVDMVFEDVKEDLMEQYGYTSETAVDLIYNAGYRIYATVDPEIQAIAESVYEDVSNLDYQSNGKQLQSGITIMDPYTGEVVASVGGIGEKEGKRTFSYATAKRPCGSAIKPLSVYAPAIENGVITPASVYDDYPVSLNSSGTGGYPKNDPSRYRGLVTLATAINYSVNTVAVRVLNEMGYDISYDFMVNKLGFDLEESDLAEAPLAMGGFTYGVSTQEMAAGYSAFINNGIYTEPRTYLRVTDDTGNEIILDNEAHSQLAMSEATAYQINNLLQGVMRSGTGTLARLDSMTTAGKTGTTSDNYDRYFVGYTPYYCAAVWVGYGDNTTVRVSGGNPAARLWHLVMSQVHEGLEDKDFNTPSSGLSSVRVCTKSGLLPGDGCTTQTVTVTAGNEPTETCTLHVTVDFCTETGLPATEFCPEESRETRTFLNYDRQTVYLPTGAVTDPETGEVISQGTPIVAEDNDQLLSTALAMGSCTAHTASTEPVDPDNPDAGLDPDNPVDPDNPDEENPYPNDGSTIGRPNPPAETEDPEETQPQEPETPAEPDVPSEPPDGNQT